ncbi:TniQ family protein [Chachezhania sediminis]|uniref:hypothetical protein n=1 Tax=Chachezhania sediminis TaxID=2599291 RepID=UPI00131D8A78|nr:hypothetical protein [Chachezhania sediminis]
MRFRGEVFVSRALRNPVIRGCPHCLRAQANGQPHPLRHVALPGDWLCRGVDICLQHCHPLAPLWTRSRPIERDDTGARLAEILSDLSAGSYDTEHVAPSDYDLWIDRRLSQGADDTWLSSQPLFAAMTFCDLVGAALLRKRGEEADGRRAKAAGFAHASLGPDDIRNALDSLTRSADGGHMVTKGELGPLFEIPGHSYRDDVAFGGLRDILRSHLLDVWPLSPGEDLLGETVTERRLRSLLSASRETGIGTAVLNDFLTEAGALSPDDRRADARKTFQAPPCQALLDEIPTLVGPIAMRRAIGATLAELKALEADGILVPKTRVATIKSPWRIADGLSLVEELEACAVLLDGDAPGWETIQLAHKRLGIPVGRIMAAVRAGALRLGKRADVFGYHGFVVDIAEMAALKEPKLPRGEPPPVVDGVSATAFARSVGIRGKGNFLALVEGGYTPAVEVLHPTTKRPQWRMDRDDIAAFHARFATPTVLVAETGAHRNTILAALNALGIEAFQPSGLNIGPIYLRSDLEPALRLLKA